MRMDKLLMTYRFIHKDGQTFPDEYDWETQFDAIDPALGFIELDAGKVRGLAAAYYDLLAEYALLHSEWVNERARRA